MIDIPTTEISVFQPNGDGTYLEGRYIPAPKTQVETFASVQPLRGSEINMLPEGRRNTEAVKIYTDLKMFVSDEKNKRNATTLLYDGKYYEVHNVENWHLGTDIQHYKVVAIKIDGEGEGLNAES